MRKANIYFHGILAGILIEESKNNYKFKYSTGYKGPPVSLTMPVSDSEYKYSEFPPFFDGLLPEGVQLDSLLRQNKLDADDYLSQLIAVGKDLVGAVTVSEAE